MFSVVVAMDKNRGIGREGRLPWKLAGDMRFFKDLTTCPDRAAVERRYRLAPESDSNAFSSPEEFFARLKTEPQLPMPDPNLRNAVLMGRNTWESLPPAYKPLPGRVNGVLSRGGTQGGAGTHKVFGDLDQALQELDRDESVSEVYVIGGAQIYADALRSPACGRIYATTVESEFPCDVFFPDNPDGFREVAAGTRLEEDGIPYRFHLWQRDIK